MRHQIWLEIFLSASSSYKNIIFIIASKALASSKVPPRTQGFHHHYGKDFNKVKALSCQKPTMHQVLQTYGLLHHFCGFVKPSTWSWATLTSSKYLHLICGDVWASWLHQAINDHRMGHLDHLVLPIPKQPSHDCHVINHCPYFVLNGLLSMTTFLIKIPLYHWWKHIFK